MIKSKYTVAQIAAMSQAEAASIPEGYHQVLFSSGEALPMLSREILTNWFFWHMHVQNNCTTEMILPEDAWVWVRYLKDGTKITRPITAGVFLGLGEVTIRNIVSQFPEDESISKHIFEIAEAYYNVVNTIYNFVGENLATHYTTGDIFHYVSFLSQAPVQEALKEYMRDPKLDEGKVYSAIEKVADSEDYPELDRNEVRRGVSAGTLNRRSIHQSFGPRGIVKEINGKSMVVPVTTSYLEGLNTLYDAMAEGRSASRALYAQSTQLEDAEYLSRRVRLAAGTITKIVGLDCGTKDYIKWTVEAHHLDVLQGNYIMLDDGHKHCVSLSDTHLIGQTVNLRNPTTCINENSQTVCACCMGKLANTFIGGNLGVSIVFPVMSKTSQKILSVKHLEQSISPILININGHAKRVLALDSKNKWNISLRPLPDGQYYKVQIGGGETNWLTTVRELDDVEELTPSRLNNITEITVQHYSKAGKLLGAYTQDLRPVDTLRVGCHFSREFIKYIKERGWVLHEDGMAEFDLSGWDTTRNTPTLLHCARVNKDTRQYLLSLENFLFGTDKAQDDDSESSDQAVGQASSIESCRSRHEALSRLSDLFTPPPGSVLDKNTSIQVNLAEIGIFVKIGMARDPDNGDFSYPRGDEDFKFVKFDTLIKSRGLGGALAFQHQYRLLTRPGAYVAKPRIGTYMDDFL